MVVYGTRPARPGDEDEIAEMCALLWPQGSREEHRREIEKLLHTGMCGTLPGTVLVAPDRNEQLAGFIEIGLRSHADGCDTARPVGFVEGWFVREGMRGRGIGNELMRAAEEWAREQKCVEIASDALLDNSASQSAHSALGFEIVDRCVHFRKAL
jgi:aminoglycoside 6'-N-acetyltransferase I